MRRLSTFFIALISSYIALVTATWGFIEAYTYFQGDGLKRMLGENWVLLYILPAVISFFIATIRIFLFQKNVNLNDERIFNRTPDVSISNQIIGKYFRCKGLLWKPGRFSFQNPTPVCPRKDCYRPIDCFRINPPQYLISADLREMQDFVNKHNTFRFVYRCPLHGDIANAPNESLQELIRQAKDEQNRK